MRSQVKTESLYGTNLSFFFPADWSAKADITSPRVVKDLQNTTFLYNISDILLPHFRPDKWHPIFICYKNIVLVNYNKKLASCKFYFSCQRNPAFSMFKCINTL